MKEGRRSPRKKVTGGPKRRNNFIGEDGEVRIDSGSKHNQESPVTKNSIVGSNKIIGKGKSTMGMGFGGIIDSARNISKGSVYAPPEKSPRSNRKKDIANTGIIKTSSSKHKLGVSLHMPDPKSEIVDEKKSRERKYSPVRRPNKSYTMVGHGQV